MNQNYCKYTDCDNRAGQPGFRNFCTKTIDNNYSCGSPPVNNEGASNFFCIAVNTVGFCPELIGCLDGNLKFLSLEPCASITSSKSAQISPTTTGPSFSASLTPSATGTVPFIGVNPPSASSSTIEIPVQAKDGVPAGAVAGVAIGALIVGAFIASIIFFLLFRRYKRRNAHSTSYTEHIPPFNGAASHGNEKSQMVVGHHNAATSVDNYLPQPAEDDAITGELSRIRDKIKNHTQSFYTTSAVDPNAVDQGKLVDLATATGIPPAKIHDLFLNPSTRFAAIRLYLSWEILSRCGTERISGASLLPGEIANFASLLSSSSGGTTGRNVLATKWKAISAELLQHKVGQPAGTAELDQSIRQAIASADAILVPFVDPTIEGGSDKRLRNLESTIRKAAQFAFLLFSQPSVFKFGWVAPKGAIVIFPGLQQLVNEEGGVAPRVFSEAEIVGA